jgi:integrase
MARNIHRLTDKQVRTATKPLGDGGGLWVYPKGNARNWVFRYSRSGKQTEMGLGGYPDVSLAEARQRAAEARALRQQGIDPLEHRRQQEAVSEAAEAAVPSFTSAAAAYIRSKRRAWSNIRHAREWPSSLKRYARAKIGSKPVDQVDTADVLAVLTPVWHSRPETASRVQSRLENVLDFSAAIGWRDQVNPARWKGHLDRLLPSPTTIKRQQNGGAVPHYPAMPFSEVPAFMADLRRLTSPSAAALRFLILTCCRTSEVLKARWCEVDFDSRTWTIPANRMKARVEHRVPLSAQAIEVLKSVPRVAGNPFVFPGARHGKPLSGMALLMCMRKQGHGVNGEKSNAVPHAFRSSFADWAGEETGFPTNVVEAALAHRISNAVQAAYERGDKYRKRVELMQAWADYCDGAAAANVVPIRRTA